MIRRATLPLVTKRRDQHKRAPNANAKEIVLRVDGADWHPSNADPIAILTLAAAYAEGLRAVAKASGLRFTMRGLEIRDECVAVSIGVDRLAPAIDAARELDAALSSKATVAGASMLMDRIRAALHSLPTGVRASVRVGRRWTRSLRVESELRPGPVGELITVRARPIRAGGATPVVRFSADSEPADFTLPCTEEVSRELGARLYREVEIEASVVRGADGQIESGQLIGFAAVDSDDDPAASWERWFEVNGRGWDDESVEAFIGRRED